MGSLVSCKKNKEYCWQTYDQLGNPMAVVCDKTESEIQALYGPYYERADVKKILLENRLQQWNDRIY